MLCDCVNSLKNTGLPSCAYLLAYAVGAILVPLEDSAGVANKIPSGSVVDNAFMIARFNDTDPSQRFYPIKDIKNANPGEQADPTYQTFDDDSKKKVRDGISSGTFIIPDSTPQFLAVMQSFECEQMGIFFYDKAGVIMGLTDNVTGDLLPVPISNGTLNAKGAFATGSTNHIITVTFDWDTTANPANIRGYSNTVNWSSPTVAGLSDVYANSTGATTPTTTTFQANLYYNYGALNTPMSFRGGVTADFKVRNETTAALLTPSSVVESATVPGLYTFTFAAQTSTNVLHPVGTKTGFDFTEIQSYQVVVP